MLIEADADDDDFDDDELSDDEDHESPIDTIDEVVCLTDATQASCAEDPAHLARLGLNAQPNVQVELAAEEVAPLVAPVVLKVRASDADDESVGRRRHTPWRGPTLLQVLCFLAALALLGLHFLRRAIDRGSRRPCLHPPDTFRNSTGGWVRPWDHTALHAEPRFVTIWSTARPPSARERRCLESVFHHHPKASVVVYTNKLAATHFGEFRAAGFDVKVQRFALRDLLQGTPAEPWLREISAHESGPYYYSHVTDVLRLALLFRDGGVYLDTDVVLARPLRLAHVASRWRAAAPTSSPAPTRRPCCAPARSASSRTAACRWSSTGAPAPPARARAHGDGRRRARAQRRGALLRAGLAVDRARRVRRRHRGDQWGWNGPGLLVRVEARCGAADDGASRRRPSTRCTGPRRRSTRPGGPTRGAVVHHRAAQHAVHLWNRKTAGAEPSGSVVERLLSSWRVLPPITVLPNYPGTVAPAMAPASAPIVVAAREALALPIVVARADARARTRRRRRRDIGRGCLTTTSRA